MLSHIKMKKSWTTISLEAHKSSCWTPGQNRVVGPSQDSECKTECKRYTLKSAKCKKTQWYIIHPSNDHKKNTSNRTNSSYTVIQIVIHTSYTLMPVIQHEIHASISSTIQQISHIVIILRQISFKMSKLNEKTQKPELAAQSQRTVIIFNKN